MTGNDLISMISTVGFPIVAFLITCYALKYAFDKGREDSNRYFEQVTKLADAVNNNTIVLTKLVERLDEIDDGK